MARVKKCMAVRSEMVREGEDVLGGGKRRLLTDTGRHSTLSEETTVGVLVRKLGQEGRSLTKQPRRWLRRPKRANTA